MLSQQWHTRVVAYRLEDEHGNSPYYYDGRRVWLPEGYMYAFLNPSRFKESEYRHFCYKMDLYEYLLLPSVLTYPTGEVLFRADQIISKTKTGR